MTNLVRHFCLCIAFVAIGFASSVAGAHEGHGTSSLSDGHGATHYVTEPLHVAQIVVVAAALFCVATIAARARFSRNCVSR